MAAGNSQQGNQDQRRQQKTDRCADIRDQVNIARMIGHAENAIEGPGAGKNTKRQYVNQRVARKAFGQQAAFGQPGGTKECQQVATTQQGQQAEIKVHGDGDAIRRWLQAESNMPRSGTASANGGCETATGRPAPATAAVQPIKPAVADGADTLSGLGFTQAKCAGNPSDVPVCDSPEQQFIPLCIDQLAGW